MSKRHRINPLTGQKERIGDNYNPLTGKRIPKGHYEDFLTGRLIKKGHHSDPLTGRIIKDSNQQKNHNYQNKIRNNQDPFYNPPSTNNYKSPKVEFGKFPPIIQLLIGLFALYLAYLFVATLKPELAQQIKIIFFFGIGAVILVILLYLFSKKESSDKEKIRNFFEWLFTTPQKTQENKTDARYKTPPLSFQQKHQLMEKVRNHCEYCQERYTLDVHHIIHRSEGGSNEQTNLIVLCAKCHRMAHGGGISKGKLFAISKNRRHNRF